jgi:hypothetical protein
LPEDVSVFGEPLEHLRTRTPELGEESAEPQRIGSNGGIGRGPHHPSPVVPELPGGGIDGINYEAVGGVRVTADEELPPVGGPGIRLLDQGVQADPDVHEDRPHGHPGLRGSPEGELSPDGITKPGEVVLRGRVRQSGELEFTGLLSGPDHPFQ